MTDIERLETAVGKPIEQWNVSDLEKFSLDENLELLQLLKKTEVISECISRSKQNREVADIFVPLYIKSQITDAESAGNEILRKHEEKEISDEQLKDETLKMLDHESFYYHLVGDLIAISMIPSYNLSEREISIKEDIGSAKEVVCGLVENDLANCYTLIMDVLELIFPFRAKYYEAYNVDIVEDEDQRLELALDNIRQMEMAIKEELENMAAVDEDTPAILSELEGDESNG